MSPIPNAPELLMVSQGLVNWISIRFGLMAQDKIKTSKIVSERFLGLSVVYYLIMG